MDIKLIFTQSSHCTTLLRGLIWDIQHISSLWNRCNLETERPFSVDMILGRVMTERSDSCIKATSHVVRFSSAVIINTHTYICKHVTLNHLVPGHNTMGNLSMWHSLYHKHCFNVCPCFHFHCDFLFYLHVCQGMMSFVTMLRIVCSFCSSETTHVSKLL